MKRSRATMLPLLSSITLAVVLALVVQDVDGDQRIVLVSEPFNDDDGDIVTNSGDVNVSSLLCCTYGNCSCHSFDNALDHLSSNVLLNITTDVMLSLPIIASNIENVSITGHNNPTVNCKGVGGIHFTFCNNCIIQDITWDECGTGNIDNDTVPGLKLSYSSNITIQNCSFQHSIGQAVVLSDISGDVNINHCKFVNNKHYRGHGAAISYSLNNIMNYPTLLFKTCNCNFSHNEGAESLVYIKNSMPELNNNIILCDSIFYNNQGVSIYVINQKVYLKGKLLFQNNRAYDGTGIYIDDNSTVLFSRNSNVEFIQNSAYHYGGAIYSKGTLLFTDDSTTVFSNNDAGRGGAIYSDVGSTISFEDNSTTEFSNNSADYGGAIGSNDDNTISFEIIKPLLSMYAMVLGFITSLGRPISSIDGSTISFEDNSITVFSNNNAGFRGGAIHSHSLSFEDNSTTVFSNNNAIDGGAIYSYSNTISFEDNSTTKFTSNKAYDHGGAICSNFNSTISFEDNSTTVFSNNNGINGGAIYSNDGSTISFEDNSTTVFSNNIAITGGAIYSKDGSTISFEDNSTAVFSNNSASDFYGGGAIHIRYRSTVSFKDYSTTKFSSNNAVFRGGAVGSYVDSTISFEDNSTTVFSNNNAGYRGGAIYSLDGSTLSFEDNSITVFSNNNASYDGGAICSDNGSTIYFKGISTTEFSNNNANIDGGAVTVINSNILFADHGFITFYNNEAKKYGGAGYFNMQSNIVLGRNAKVSFENNKAQYGGALCIDDNVNVTFKENSAVSFKNNMATADGGAINLITYSDITVKDYAKITFADNNAQYGGAMCFDTTFSTLVFNNYKGSINFINNIATIAGKSVYLDLSGSCDKSCLSNRIIGIKNASKQFIATPPNKLEFYNPAICIDDEKTECNTYYVNHVMLGQEINIPACVLNYYDQPADATQFLLHNTDYQNYTFSGSSQILLSCDTPLQGISIIGNKRLSESLNYSTNIILHDVRNSNWKQIIVKLTFEFTSCYPGFWQYTSSQKCECYNASDIVFCSGSRSTIKRGYWFGTVTGKPTVTLCPINYCNFTCCETSNGYYYLSPVRDNQCRSHRSGTACGSCIHGYTLSFDSTECVSINSCTAGQTVLVILLTVIYWIVIVTLVFVMMYCKVGIGYLYSITYYYSIVDILLSQNLYTSRGFYLTVSIMSSFSKITPQFLGELCLTTGMSGIDQQIIHYTHPLAVIVILVMISLLARRSRRFTTIIGHGIIHVICCLLLLSYTSVASTSLLLMRPLKFHTIDEVYTYLSPDIEYFHGRHLAYGIIALLCTISFVIGLPLLLILEPFLNHKINFIKIKPLLDQFQGCYKDKYRFFAGYYMSCRLVIISIVIANSSNDFVANYMLIAVCGIIALIHLTLKPYSNDIINKFDGVILQLSIFIAMLPLLDDFDSPFVITMAFILIILPLLNFIAMTLFLHKDDLKKIVACFSTKDESPRSNNDVSNDKAPKKEFHLIIDDSMRKNAIICDV